MNNAEGTELRCHDESILNQYRWATLSSYLPNEGVENEIDEGELRKVIGKIPKEKDLFLTLVSKEYLPIAYLWIQAVVKRQVNFVIIACDDESYAKMLELKVRVCKASIKYVKSAEKIFSLTNFPINALQITRLKFRAVKILLSLKFRVVFLDLDAFLLKQFDSSQFDADIAFQRVVYFPKFIVQKWGFAACTGFLAFKPLDKVKNFIDDCVSLQSEYYSDQLVFNLALSEKDIQWSNLTTRAFVPEHLNTCIVDNFKTIANENIIGKTGINNISVMALSAKRFWRNAVVEPDFSRMTLYHPNSPKFCFGKLQVFIQDHIKSYI